MTIHTTTPADCWELAKTDPQTAALDCHERAYHAPTIAEQRDWADMASRIEHHYDLPVGDAE